MANEVVGIEIKAELSAFREQLAKLPDIGTKEARALTSQLSREIRKAETASKRAAAQSKKTADAFKAQAKATKQVADATEETNKSLRDLGAAVVSIELLKQAFALVKDAIAGTLERAQRLDREMGGNLTPTIEATSSAISDLKDSAVQPLIPFITTLAQGIEDTARGAEIAVRAIFGLTDATEELRAQRAREDGAVEKLADKVDTLKTKYNELEQASLKAFPRSVAFVTPEMEEVAESITRTQRALKRLRGEFNGEREDRRAAILQLIEDGKTDTETTLTRSRVAVEASKREKAAIIEVAAARRAAYAESADARQKASIEAEAAAERIKLAELDAIDAAAAAREEAGQRETDMRTSLRDLAIDTTAAVTGSILDGLRSVLTANVKEARKRAEIELGLAILRGELQAAGAFGTTLATYGATPQGFILAAAAAAAVGIQSKAAAAAGYAAASQQFHSGGEVRGASPASEVPASLSPGEYVLNRQAVAAVGADVLGSMNAGQSAAGSSVGVFVVDHRVAGAITSKAMRDPGSSIAQRLASLAPAVGGYAPHG